MSSTTHESQLTALRARSAAIDLTLADLDREFAALDVTDQGALKRAHAIEAQVAQLQKEKLVVLSVALAARHNRSLQQQQEQAAAEQEQQRKQDLAAKQLADALAAVHVDLDRALVALRERFERRHSLLAQLMSSGAANTAFLPKLLGKASATRAACAAGLHRHIGIEVCAPGSMQPLQAANSTLLGIGRTPDVASTRTQHPYTAETPAAPETDATALVETTNVLERPVLRARTNGSGE